MKGSEHLFVGAASIATAAYAFNHFGGRIPLGAAALAVGAAGLGALAPDIDHPSSTVSRRIPRKLFEAGAQLLALPLVLAIAFVALGGSRGEASKLLGAFAPLIRWGLMFVGPAAALVLVSWVVRRFTRHRGATHSFVFGASASVLLSILALTLRVAWWIGPVFFWGWLTHLLLDGVTHHGVPALFWPFEGRLQEARENTPEQRIEQGRDRSA